MSAASGDLQHQRGKQKFLVAAAKAIDVVVSGGRQRNQTALFVTLHRLACRRFSSDLVKGGIFIYPADSRSPRGKLRYLYEAAPLALICEQAGGSASDGERRILDIEPTDIHQRVPLFIGSRAMVEQAVQLLGPHTVLTGQQTALWSGEERPGRRREARFPPAVRSGPPLG
jgi:fructose-1,6-bisphosphatase